MLKINEIKESICLDILQKERSIINLNLDHKLIVMIIKSLFFLLNLIISYRIKLKFYKEILKQNGLKLLIL